MFTRKILTAALVALTLAGAAVGSTGSAQAGPWPHGGHGGHGNHGGWSHGSHGGWNHGFGHGHGWGRSWGGPAVVYVAPARRCFFVERTNRYGEVIGTRKVCRIAGW